MPFPNEKHSHETAHACESRAASYERSIHALACARGRASRERATARFVLLARAMAHLKAAKHASDFGFPHAAILLVGEARQLAAEAFAVERTGPGVAWFLAHAGAVAARA